MLSTTLDFLRWFSDLISPFSGTKQAKRDLETLIYLFCSLIICLSWLIIVLSLLLLTPTTIHAGETPFFLPGGGMFTKKVKSFKERRLTKVIPQTLDYSCGAAALATLLQYHFGQEISEKEVTVGMFEHGDKDEIRKRGFSMLDMKRFANSRGLQAEGYKIKDVSTLENLKIPVIVIIETGRYKHFVVLRKVDQRFAYLSDPSWGNRRIPLEDFLKSWNQIILAVTGAIKDTPQGLYCEEDDLRLPKNRAVHNSAVLGHRFSMDPTNAIYRVTPTVTTGIPGITR
jgi:predicted double-glycine peptidase